MMRWGRISGAVLAFGLSWGCIAPAQAQTLAASQGIILELIREVEANGSYTRVYGGLSQRPPRPITSMSIGEVLTWQRNLGRVTSTASGGYQFIKGTLGDTADYLGFSHNRLFDEATQDALASYWVNDCRRQSNERLHAFANCLAGVWAGFPLVTGPDRGKSRYHDVAGNRARMTAQAYLAVLSGETLVAVIDRRPRPLTGATAEDVTRLASYRPDRSATPTVRPYEARVAEYRAALAQTGPSDGPRVFHHQIYSN